MSLHLSLLGPQRPEPNLRRVLDAHDVSGPLAVITAGWRHDESEVGALKGHSRRAVAHLPLYRWFEQVQASLPDIAKSYAERQRRIKAYKDLYRLRMNTSFDAVRQLLERVADSDKDADLIDDALQSALQVVRSIDAELDHVLPRIRDEFPEVARPWEIPGVRDRHEEARALIEASGAICIAGGHVGVLRNRMDFFGLDVLVQRALAEGKRVIGWSAGAMVMTERIALFYDDPPEGQSEAEVLDTGIGLAKGIVVFPHAARRLRLDDPQRVARLAIRFHPAHCVTLEHGAWLEQSPDGWHNRGPAGSASELTDEGAVVAVGAKGGV